MSDEESVSSRNSIMNLLFEQQLVEAYLLHDELQISSAV